jgi:hypothetical protein
MARSEESDLGSEEEQSEGGEGDEQDSDDGERENGVESPDRGKQSNRKDDSDVPLYLRVQNRALDNEAAANNNGRTRKLKKKTCS